MKKKYTYIIVIISLICVFIFQFYEIKRLSKGSGITAVNKTSYDNGNYSNNDNTDNNEYVDEAAKAPEQEETENVDTSEDKIEETKAAVQEATAQPEQLGNQEAATPEPVQETPQTEAPEKSDIGSPLSEPIMGVDVSVFQGTIDWQAAKAAGVQFAMLQVGYRGYGSGTISMDGNFDQNIKGATDAGIAVGIYFFSQAISVDEAIEEAQFTLDKISGYKVTYPVAFDIESIPDSSARTNTAGLTNNDRTQMCIAFCEKVKSAGYIPSVYSCQSYFNDNLNAAEIASYYPWVANFDAFPSCSFDVAMWQSTDSGSVNGIGTQVDMDYCYKKFN